MKAVAVALAVALTGCAEQQFWHELPDAPLPDKIQVVTLPSVAAWCSEWPGAIACTRCDPLTRECTIYLSRQAATRCYLLHELTHAAGFRHPNFAETNAGCFFHSERKPDHAQRSHLSPRRRDL